MEPLDAVLADMLAQSLVFDSVVDEDIHPLRNGELGHRLGQRRLIVQVQLLSKQSDVHIRGRPEGPRGAGAEEDDPHLLAMMEI